MGFSSPAQSNQATTRGRELLVCVMRFKKFSEIVFVHTLTVNDVPGAC